MKKYFAYCLFFSLLFSCLVLPAWAQNRAQALNADRPDRTQSPTVVPWGTLQIETGLQFQNDESNILPTKEYLYPEALVRISILKWGELRLNAEYKKESHLEGTNKLSHRMVSEIGFNNLQVGTKLKFYTGKGVIPAIGFQGNITLPWGSETFRPMHVAPEGALLFSNIITNKLEVQCNVGYGQQQTEEKYRGQLFYSALASLKLTNKLQGYGEYFAQKAKASSAENNVDVGLQLLLLPNLQFDVAAGAGISEAAPDYFVGTGVTWRLPH